MNKIKLEDIDFENLNIVYTNVTASRRLEAPNKVIRVEVYFNSDIEDHFNTLKMLEDLGVIKLKIQKWIKGYCNGHYIGETYTSIDNVFEYKCLHCDDRIWSDQNLKECTRCNGPVVKVPKSRHMI